ncbi:hypothetical protein ACOMHN_057789 [Nucella lapillus]
MGSRRRSPSDTTPLPVCVEAVLQFGYSKDLVLSTYQQLSRSREVQSGHEASGGEWGHGPTPGHVTAALLMTSLDAILERGSTYGHDGSHAAAYSQDSLSASARGVGNDLEADGSGDEPEALTSSPRVFSAASDDSSRAERQVAATNNENTPHTPTEANTPILPTPMTADAPSSTASSTGTFSGAESQVPTGSTPDATTSASESNSSTASVSGQVSVSPASSSGVSGYSTVSQQLPEPRRSTSASSGHSEPPRVSVTGRESTSAKERDRERRRLLTKVRALREENKHLKTRQKCRKCRQNPVDLTFLPCGHFLFCHSCGSSFQACPFCHKTILADVKTYLS